MRIRRLNNVPGAIFLALGLAVADSLSFASESQTELSGHSSQCLT